MPNKKEILVLIISAILGALVTGGVIGSYFHYFQSQDQSPERLSSEGVVQKMIEKMAEVKSLEYSGQIEAEGEIDNLAMPFPLGGKGDSSQSKQPSPTKRKGKFSIDFNGSSDIQNPNNPKMQFKIGINTNLSPKRFTLEVRVIDKIGYLKLDDLPDDLGFDTSFLKGQWIKSDFKAIKKEKYSKEVQKEQKISPEQKKEIKEAIAKAKIFKITKELQDEKIEGVDTHHYKLSINKEEVIQLFIEISKILFPNESLNEKELKGSLTASFDNEAIESVKGEIWIGKEDFLLYKLLFSSAIKETEKTKSEGKLTIQTQFKNYNKPVQIDIPKPAKPFEEVLSALFGGALSKGMQGSQPNIKCPFSAPYDAN